MASQSAIDAITIQLPDEAEDFGLDETIVGNFIDSGLSTTKVMLECWRVLAAKTSTITDVSESGSSRTMPLFDRAKLMVDFWQLRSDDEDRQTSVLPVRAHAASHKAVRV